VRVADSEAEVSGQRMPGAERAGNQAASQQPFGDRGSALRRPEVREDEVRVGRTNRPTRGAEFVGEAPALVLDSFEVRIEDRVVEERLGGNGDRAAGTG